MIIQPKYISFRNLGIISRNNNFEVYQQHSKGRVCLSLSCLQQLEVLSVYSMALPGLLLTLPVLLPMLPIMLLVHPGALMVNTISPVLQDISPALPGTPEYHYIITINCGIWPPWASHLTTLKYSHRLPVTKVNCVGQEMLKDMKWVMRLRAEDSKLYVND